MDRTKKIIVSSLLALALTSSIFMVRARRGGRGGGMRGGRSMGRAGMRGGRGGFKAVGFRGPRGRGFAARGRGWRAAGWRGRGGWGRGRWGRGWKWRGRWGGIPWWRRWRFRPTWWVGAWPPMYIDEEITLEDRALDDKGQRYWEVFNSTDIPLTFYSDDGSTSTLAPGQRVRIFRGRSFGFAVVSQDGSLLNDGSTTKHFITLFQRGSAADYTNREGKWLR